MEIVNHVIYDKLCLGILSDNSKREFIRIIDGLRKQGAQGVILGCTGLLIKQEDTTLPVFDTTQIHPTKAAMCAIRKYN